MVSSFKSKSHSCIQPNVSGSLFLFPGCTSLTSATSTSDPARLRLPSSWPTDHRWRNSDNENRRDPTVRWERLTLVVGGNKTDVWRSYCIIVAIFSSCDFHLVQACLKHLAPAFEAGPKRRSRGKKRMDGWMLDEAAEFSWPLPP